MRVLLYINWRSTPRAHARCVMANIIIKMRHGDAALESVCTYVAHGRDCAIYAISRARSLRPHARPGGVFAYVDVRTTKNTHTHSTAHKQHSSSEACLRQRIKINKFILETPCATGLESRAWTTRSNCLWIHIRINKRSESFCANEHERPRQNRDVVRMPTTTSNVPNGARRIYV